MSRQSSQCVKVSGGIFKRVTQTERKHINHIIPLSKGIDTPFYQELLNFPICCGAISLRDRGIRQRNDYIIYIEYIYRIRMCRDICKPYLCPTLCGITAVTQGSRQDAGDLAAQQDDLPAPHVNLILNP